MKHHIDATALFRLSILGPLASREHFEAGELKKLIQQLSEQIYKTPEGDAVQFGVKTIERWYYCWKKQGIDGLAPNTRSDKNSCQLDKNTQDAIVNCKKSNPARSINTIIACLECNLQRKNRNKDKFLLSKNIIIKRDNYPIQIINNDISRESSPESI